jgi:hypothetical protein
MIPWRRPSPRAMTTELTPELSPAGRGDGDDEDDEDATLLVVLLLLLGEGGLFEGRPPALPLSEVMMMMPKHGGGGLLRTPRIIDGGILCCVAKVCRSVVFLLRSIGCAATERPAVAGLASRHHTSPRKRNAQATHQQSDQVDDPLVCSYEPGRHRAARPSTRCRPS